MIIEDRFFKTLLNEWVAKDVVFNPHDFKYRTYKDIITIVWNSSAFVWELDTGHFSIIPRLDMGVM